MATTATVRLTRTGQGQGEGQSQGQGRPWDVAIDGTVVDSVSRGETLELSVETGHHTLQVRSRGIFASPERYFDTRDGQVVGFSCRTRAKHPFIVQRSLVWLIASLFTRRSWITLTPDEDYLADLAARGDETPVTGDADASNGVGDSDSVGDGATASAMVAMPSALPRQPRQPRRPPDSTTEAVLTVNGLTKRFGRRTAFSDVSFEVLRGEVFGFLGPNGAGKTTTVRTLGTMIAPTSGSATVAGIPLTPENGVEIRQRVSIMPEAPGLYLRLTVAENLEYFAGLYGLRHPAGRIVDALDAVNLGDRAGDLCGSLSKGLRQRVGLARTLMSDPAIMFLDEPTSGLDPVAAREVHDLVDGLRQRGVTIFLTTHRLDEAEKLCDRVAILNTTLRTIGRPADLRAQLFKDALIIETLAPLDDPGALFSSLPAVEKWNATGASSYELEVADLRVAAPQVTRGLVAAGADVLSIGEAQHSLEDVYLELISEDVEGASTVMGLDTNRIRAVVRKELRDYRRKRAIVVTMAVLPILFLVEPVVTIFIVPPTLSGSSLSHSLVLPMLYLLLIPTVMPSTLAAYTVAGEREQGTLEPLLTTPIRQQEFIVGKAAAVLIPTMLAAYTVFGLFLAAVALFAQPGVATAFFDQGAVLLALFLLAPLLASWAIVVGMAISVRASEVRVAQQLGTLASFPPVVVILLLAVGVLHPTVALALEFAAALLVIDLVALRLIAGMFDRERLVTGAKAA